jgi:hypothetical protein
MKTLTELNVGDYVYWHDPDDDLCSGPGEVLDISGDMFIIAKDDGGEVAALENELEKL